MLDAQAQRRMCLVRDRSGRDSSLILKYIDQFDMKKKAKCCAFGERTGTLEGPPPLIAGPTGSSGAVKSMLHLQIFRLPSFTLRAMLHHCCSLSYVTGVCVRHLLRF
jgi:hypothetical protein